MRLITTPRITAALLAAALTLPVGAWAQSTATAATTQTPNSHQAKVEQRIADMHATLHITKPEEAQWDAFAQVMLDNAQAMDMLLTKDSSERATQNAEQILQTYAQVTEQHAQNVQKLSTAFHTLYSSLSPEQQKAADEMFREKAQRHEEKKKENG